MPLLQQIKKIKEFVYTPAALSAGCKGIAHKAAGTVHQLHIDTPAHVDLKTVCRSVKGCTTDMGDEMGIRGFTVPQADKNLHTLCQRCAPPPPVPHGLDILLNNSLNKLGLKGPL